MTTTATPISASEQDSAILRDKERNSRKLKFHAAGALAGFTAFALFSAFLPPIALLTPVAATLSCMAGLVSTAKFAAAAQHHRLFRRRQGPKQESFLERLRAEHPRIAKWSSRSKTAVAICGLAMMGLAAGSLLAAGLSTALVVIGLAGASFFPAVSPALVFPTLGSTLAGTLLTASGLVLLADQKLDLKAASILPVTGNTHSPEGRNMAAGPSALSKLLLPATKFGHSANRNRREAHSPGPAPKHGVAPAPKM